MLTALDYRLPPDNREFQPGIPVAVRATLLYVEALKIANMPHDVLGDPNAVVAALPGPDAQPTGPFGTYAYVSGNRWVCDCPFCTGSQMVDRSDQRFFCNYCLNVRNGGAFISVTWPSETDEAAATLVLDRRPPGLRNWFPFALANGGPETVDDLAAENAANGIA